MDYLIQQISTYMLIAFLVGAIYGWLVRAVRANRDQQAAKEVQEATLLQHRQECQRLLEKIERLELIPDTGGAEDWQDDYPIDVISDIESSTLSKLKNLGIQTTKQLFTLCEDDDAIYHLASDIAVEDFVIQRWVSIADLLRVANIEVDDAQLLEATEIYSLSDLSKQKPQRLGEKLAKTNQQHSLLTVIPDADKLRAWIEHADHMLSQQA
jgi:hypothetical protein